MSDKHDDGGSAFPKPDDIPDYDNAGMALLDWFAGQALAPLQQHYQQHYPWASLQYLAQDAYTLADAMIAEKRRREAQPE